MIIKYHLYIQTLIALFISVTLSACGGSGSSVSNDVNDNNNSSDTDANTEYVYKPLTIKTDPPGEDNFRNVIYTYDDNGNVLSQVNDNRHYVVTTYKYDENGNLLEKVIANNADASPQYNHVYTYDDDGNELTYSLNDVPISIKTYDANGKIFTSNEKFDEDGNPRSITTITYHSNGKISTKSDSRSILVSIFRYSVFYTNFVSYDDKGNVLTESYDSYADQGSGADRKTYTRTYDANGIVLTEYSYSARIYGINNVGDEGLVAYYYDRYSINNYAANGTLSTKNITETTTDFNNVPSIRTPRITTYNYDDNENLLTARTNIVPEVGNTSLEKLITNTYDTNGNLLVSRTDGDGGYYSDPTILRNLITNIYDDNGNLLSSKTEVFDSHGDQDDLKLITNTYDINGNLLTKIEKSDHFHPFLTNDLELITSSYDANGNLLTKAERDGNRLEAYIYDANGNLLTKTSSYIYNIDGNPEYIAPIEDSVVNISTSVTFTYNDIGNILTSNSDSSFYLYINEHQSTSLVQKGTVTYTYDENENQLSRSIDTNRDGIIDSTRTTTWVKFRVQ